MQAAAWPPWAPLQDQFQGPSPVTADAVPAVHRLLLGALLAAVPAALPHMPSLGVRSVLTTGCVTPVVQSQVIDEL